MEKYLVPKRLTLASVTKCLKTYEVDHLFIRLMGSKGGTVKADERLQGKKLVVLHNKSTIRFIVNKKEVCRLPLKEFLEDIEDRQGLQVAYERFDRNNNMVFLPTGVDPYDPNLLEPRRSILRLAIDWHLVEIYFKGRVHLKFHSWWIEPHFGLWAIMAPEEISN
ncbi:MAG: hypothetical protein M0P64_00965 [Candidatus Pacebacteria bacterium]|nr:hypothetical protein [Candidatus Paceibacterota bacterium]